MIRPNQVGFCFLTRLLWLTRYEGCDYWTLQKSNLETHNRWQYASVFIHLLSSPSLMHKIKQLLQFSNIVTLDHKFEIWDPASLHRKQRHRYISCRESDSSPAPTSFPSDSPSSFLPPNLSSSLPLMPPHPLTIKKALYFSRGHHQIVWAQRIWLVVRSSAEPAHDSVHWSPWLWSDSESQDCPWWALEGGKVVNSRCLAVVVLVF